MDVTELALVLLLAQTTGTLAASREYRFVNQQLTWEQAQSYCRENFVDLATIETEEDQAIVAQLIADAQAPYAWIGHYDDVDSWRWTLDNSSLNDDVYSFHTRIFNNRNGKQYCGILTSSKLDDLTCSDQIMSVCYDETSNTYAAVTAPMTWQAARNYCRQTYTDLAILRNAVELSSAQSLVTDKAWIGLVRENWKWSDQTNFSYSKWEQGQPDEYKNCGAASPTGWSDDDCTMTYPFICSVPIRKVVKVEVKTDGKVDLNDPLVQAAILRQVEMDMRDRGIQHGFKLTWRNHPNGTVFN